MKLKIIQHKSTSDLIDSVKEELSKVGYKPGTIQTYQRYWNDLLKYEANNGIISFSPKGGLEFLDAIYGIRVFTVLSKQDKVRARSITLLNDYCRNGMLFPSGGNLIPTVRFLSCFGPILEVFKEHRSRKFQLSNSTLCSYNRYLGQFLLYLEKNNISELNQLRDLEFSNLPIIMSPMYKKGGIKNEDFNGGKESTFRTNGAFNFKAC